MKSWMTIGPASLLAASFATAASAGVLPTYGWSTVNNENGWGWHTQSNAYGSATVGPDTVSIDITAAVNEGDYFQAGWSGFAAGSPDDDLSSVTVSVVYDDATAFALTSRGYVDGSWVNGDYVEISGTGSQTFTFDMSDAVPFQIYIDAYSNATGSAYLVMGAVPAPGALALLAGAGFVQGRRRRRG